MDEWKDKKCGLMDGQLERQTDGLVVELRD